VDEVATYPAVVQEGVALAWCPIAHDRFPFPFCADQELQELALGLPYLLSEAAIGLDAVEPGVMFALSHFDYTTTDWPRGVLLVPRVNAQRSPVCGQLFNVEHNETVVQEYRLGGDE